MSILGHAPWVGACHFFALVLILYCGEVLEPVRVDRAKSNLTMEEVGGGGLLLSGLPPLPHHLQITSPLGPHPRLHTVYTNTNREGRE